MDMSAMMMVVGAMADTVFLYARTIVDKVQQPFLREEGEGTKDRGWVGCAQLAYDIL